MKEIGSGFFHDICIKLGVKEASQVGLARKAYQFLLGNNTEGFFECLRLVQDIPFTASFSTSSGLEEYLLSKRLSYLLASQIAGHEGAHLDFCQSQNPPWRAEIRCDVVKLAWVTIFNLPLIFERHMGGSVEVLKRKWAEGLLAPYMYSSHPELNLEEVDWGFKLLGEEGMSRIDTLCLFNQDGHEELSDLSKWNVGF